MWEQEKKLGNGWLRILVEILLLLYGRIFDLHQNGIYILTHIYFPASGQAVVTGVVPSPPGFLRSNIYISRIGFRNPTARRFFIECC